MCCCCRAGSTGAVLLARELNKPCRPAPDGEISVRKGDEVRFPAQVFRWMRARRTDPAIHYTCHEDV